MLSEARPGWSSDAAVSLFKNKLGGHKQVQVFSDCGGLLTEGLANDLQWQVTLTPSVYIVDMVSGTMEAMDIHTNKFTAKEGKLTAQVSTPFPSDWG